MAALTRQSGADWPEIRGVVSVPGIWQADTTVVVSVMLRTPATAADVITLIGYEQLITAAMVTSEAQDGSRVADMMAVLQSRGIIEQAKARSRAAPVRCRHRMGDAAAGQP